MGGFQCSDTRRNLSQESAHAGTSWSHRPAARASSQRWGHIQAKSEPRTPPRSRGSRTTGSGEPSLVTRRGQASGLHKPPRPALRASPRRSPNACSVATRSSASRGTAIGQIRSQRRFRSRRHSGRGTAQACSRPVTVAATPAQATPAHWTSRQWFDGTASDRSSASAAPT